MKLISSSKSRQLAEEEKVRSEFTAQRNKLREKAPFIGWAGFVHHKAKHGNTAAMNIWSTMGDMMPRSMDMEADPEHIMDTLERRVDNRGNTPGPPKIRLPFHPTGNRYNACRKTAK